MYPGILLLQSEAIAAYVNSSKRRKWQAIAAGGVAAAAGAVCTLNEQPLTRSVRADQPGQVALPAGAAAQTPAAQMPAVQIPAAQTPAALLPESSLQQDYPRLHNLLQVTARIYSGGQPLDEQAFADLARLGVRTVVSVDGVRPDTVAAARHGLRYIHIPIGYDGISDQAGRSLARLVDEVQGPIYIHCHHGKHRGPAAAAVACIADGAADAAAALAVLTNAGTGEQYGGLWRGVAAYKPPSNRDSLPELVEVAELDLLTQTMTHIQHAAEQLEHWQALGLQCEAERSDAAAAQAALLIQEAYHELIRQLELDHAYDERFLLWTKQAEARAASLRQLLQSGDHAAAAKQFAAAQADCRRCHAAYRD